MASMFCPFFCLQVMALNEEIIDSEESEGICRDEPELGLIVNSLKTMDMAVPPHTNLKP